MTTSPVDPTISGTPPTLRFERRLDASAERVWRAVTDEVEMAEWFPSRVVGERSVGAPLEFPFDHDEAETFVGEVVEWSPPDVFGFTWHDDLLRFELHPDGDGTRLVFTQTIHHMTEAARTASGWLVCLAHLAHAVDGTDVDPDIWRTTYLAYLHAMPAPLGVAHGDSIVFERAHFLGPDDVEARFADAAAWGCDDLGGATISATATPWGCTYDVTVAATDATAAARWHGLLAQFDMALASGQVIVDEAWQKWIPAYETALASRSVR